MATWDDPPERVILSENQPANESDREEKKIKKKQSNLDLTMQLIVLSTLVLCCAAQGFTTSELYSFQLRANLTAAKLQTFVTGLNKQTTLAAATTYIKSFFAANVKASIRVQNQNFIIEKVGFYFTIRNLANKIFAAIKTSKLVGDTKLAELKKTFWSLDKQFYHDLRIYYSYWIEDIEKLVPASKWKALKAAITKAAAAFETANKGKRAAAEKYFGITLG